MKPGDLPDLSAEQLAAARAAYEKLYAAWPPDVRAGLIEKHLTTWRAGLAEASNLESEVYAEMRAGGPVPDVPTVVLWAAGRNAYWEGFGDADLIARTQQGLRDLHAAIAAAATDGRHVVVEGASHQYLHIEHPAAVVAAVRELLRLPAAQ